MNASRKVQIVIAALLAANLVVALVRPGNSAPPVVASAHGGGILVYGTSDIITCSQDGSTIYVWENRVSNQWTAKAYSAK